MNNEEKIWKLINHLKAYTKHFYENGIELNPDKIDEMKIAEILAKYGINPFVKDILKMYTELESDTLEQSNFKKQLWMQIYFRMNPHK